MAFDTKLANQLGKDYYHKRDDASFNLLYNFYNPFILNYLSKNFSNINRAEYDFIASNIWLNILRLIDSFNPEKRFDTWIITVIRNEAISTATGRLKSSRSLNSSKKEIGIEDGETQTDFEDLIEIQEENERFIKLEEEIYNMEYPFAVFLLAFYVYNLNHIQIGKIFGMSREKVNQTMMVSKEYIQNGKLKNRVKGKRTKMFADWAIEKERILTIWNSLDKKTLVGKDKKHTNGNK